MARVASLWPEGPSCITGKLTVAEIFSSLVVPAISAGLLTCSRCRCLCNETHEPTPLSSSPGVYFRAAGKAVEPCGSWEWRIPIMRCIVGDKDMPTNGEKVCLSDQQPSTVSVTSLAAHRERKLSRRNLHMSWLAAIKSVEQKLSQHKRANNQQSLFVRLRAKHFPTQG